MFTEREALGLVLLAALVAVVVFGIVYVPRHDGRLTDALVAVFLPTAGICWCIWQLPFRPGEHEEGGHEEERPDGVGQEKRPGR